MKSNIQTYTFSCHFISLVILEESKIFFIQTYNAEGEPLQQFEKYTMSNDTEFNTFMKRVDGKGLQRIDDENKEPDIITSLKNIRSNQYYQINASHRTAVKKGVVWSKIEDQAMEEETLMAI